MSQIEQQKRLVNLDFAASTPMRDEAVRAQRSYDASPIAGANPNSLHTLGRLAAKELETARRDIARSFGSRVRSSEIIFTSGGTESNHLALLGLSEGMRERHPQRTRVLVSSIEHDSIIDNLPQLRAEGFSTELIPVTSQGIVDLNALDHLLDDNVALVSVMCANNETGVVQPLGEITRLAHQRGALMHTDAIQGYLHIPIDFSVIGVDAASVAAHKVGGPVSTGALYLASRTPLRPLVFGGGQEAGRRAGTQDVRSIIAFAAVARTLSPHIEADSAYVRGLADKLYQTLLASTCIHATMGDPFQLDRLPGVVSIYVDGFSSEDLILQLDKRGFEVSAGSACSSGSLDPSHVLTSMGLARSEAFGSLRISFDDRVDPVDLDRFSAALLELTGGVG